jgi:DNA-binding MarR family transcriptional regulator
MERGGEKNGKSPMSVASLCNCLAVRRAARQITQLYDTELVATGLRLTQYSVLSRLDRVGPSSVQDLAAELVMDRSMLGHNLRPLECEGFIRLAVDKNDRRTRRLELTTRGKAKLEESRPFWQIAQERFESSVAAPAAKQLRNNLERVMESVAM